MKNRQTPAIPSLSNWLRPMSDKFEIVSPFEPAGDQPQAIADLCRGLEQNLRNQVLLGVTGSGKTFTMAKIIEQSQRPALIMAPN